MEKYTFIYSGNKIKMIYISGDNVKCSIIGNIYNLVDYISYRVNDNSKITFVNFPFNKLNFIINTTIKYKKVSISETYNSVIIKNKKRIRGR